MSIASRIQEIETHIGDVYDTINYSYDTTGINKNIINIPKYLKKGYIDIINNGIDTLYNNFPKVSGIGSNLSLAPTYEAPMKLNEIQGDTLQDGTPTPDTPVEIQSVTGLQNGEVCGKNLLDASKCINGYINSNGEIVTNDQSNLLTDYIKVQSDNNYTISLNTQFSNIGYALFDSNKTYISRQNNNNKTTITITIPNNVKYLRIWFNYNGTTTLTPTNILQYEPMVENNSTATSYEPYKGNTYEVNLGKNLCNNALFVASSGATINSYTDNSISITFVGTYKAATQFINITNSIYTFSIGNISNNKGRMEVYLYKNGEQVGTKQNVTANQTYTINNSSGLGDQIRLTLSNSDLTQTNEITFNNIQLEKGSQATSYSPYFTPIELNKIGNYEDRIYKDNGKWYVEKQIGKVVLNGSETYSQIDNSSYSDTILRFATNITDKKPNTGDTIKDNILSDKFTCKILNDNSTRQTNSITGQNGLIRINLFIDKIIIGGTDTNALTTWLSSNNTIINYVLNTPTYTEITNTELIEDLETLYTAKSQDGTTNISITSEDLEMILNVSALKGDA